jgi:hypothetical protein
VLLDRAADRDKDIVAPDPAAALRARLKHRPPPIETVGSSSASSYDNVLDTARQLAELVRLRAQDAVYIRTLEQTRTKQAREIHNAARERAEAEKAAAGVREEQMRRVEGERAEAVRVAGCERERAERAEARVKMLEKALVDAAERIKELEGAVESERRCRVEWENGLEVLALGSSEDV